MERISKGGHFYVGTDDQGRAILADESDERCTIAKHAYAQEIENGVWLLGIDGGYSTPVSLDGIFFLRDKGHTVTAITWAGREF